MFNMIDLSSSVLTTATTLAMTHSGIAHERFAYGDSIWKDLTRGLTALSFCLTGVATILSQPDDAALNLIGKIVLIPTTSVALGITLERIIDSVECANKKIEQQLRI